MTAKDAAVTDKAMKEKRTAKLVTAKASSRLLNDQEPLTPDEMDEIADECFQAGLDFLADLKESERLQFFTEEQHARTNEKAE